VKLVAEADAKPFLTKYECAFTYPQNEANKERALASGAITSAGEQATTNDEQATRGQKDQPIHMDPFSIFENSHLAFHFSIRVVRDQSTNHPVEMYVARVLEGSNAQEVGLVPETKILAIDGKPIEQYEASFRGGSELRAIFINRFEGDKVALIVVYPGETQPRKVVVTRRRVIWK
jgi:C-terminal processing protease CtpA/Prc